MSFFPSSNLKHVLHKINTFLKGKLFVWIKCYRTDKKQTHLPLKREIHQLLCATLYRDGEGSLHISKKQHMWSQKGILWTGAFQSTVRQTHPSFLFDREKTAPVTEAECEGPCCGMRRFLTTNGEAPGVGPTGLQREEEEKEEEGWWWWQGKWKGFTTGQLQLLDSEEGGGCRGEKACE